ncbi:MAG: hypothetical protein ONB30_00620 [candidate division KSB1 bacterium]|nr:hypothetical protein [candidate division KSB1 bacterium]
MRRNVFVAGLVLAVACFLFGFTAVEHTTQAQSAQSAQQVTGDCQQKHAKDDCKKDQGATCAGKCQEQCQEKCKADSTKTCSEKCKNSCDEKHASGQCQGHESDPCKDKEGHCKKAQPKQSEQK